MTKIVTVDLSTCGRYFFVKGALQVNQDPTWWDVTKRHWKIQRVIFDVWLRANQRSEDDWQFSSLAMAAIIEDTPVGQDDDLTDVYVACAVLGVRTDALPCVLHAAYAALREDLANHVTYLNAYVTLCRARGLRPEKPTL